MWPWLFHGWATMGWNRCSSKSSSSSSTIRGGPSFQAGYEKRTWACCWLWGLRFNSRIRFWWRQTSLYHYSWIFWLRNRAFTPRNQMFRLLFSFWIRNFDLKKLRLGEEAWLQHFSEELLRIEDANVIRVDWRKSSRQIDYTQARFLYAFFLSISYESSHMNHWILTIVFGHLWWKKPTKAASDTQLVGRALRCLMDSMSALTSFSPTRVTCIGHSLGAQESNSIFPWWHIKSFMT